MDKQLLLIDNRLAYPIPLAVMQNAVRKRIELLNIEIAQLSNDFKKSTWLANYKKYNQSIQWHVDFLKQDMNHMKSVLAGLSFVSEGTYVPMPSSEIEALGITRNTDYEQAD